MMNDNTVPVGIDPETRSAWIADFVGSVINRMLEALHPPIWPNVYLLTITDVPGDDAERDCSFYELARDPHALRRRVGLSPFENINRIRRITGRRTMNEVTAERIDETLREYFEQHQTYPHGYEPFFSKRCSLYGIDFFLVLIVPSGAEGFDAVMTDQPVNNGIYEGIVNVVGEKIDECPLFKASFSKGNIRDDLTRAVGWLCNTFEIENSMRESLAYVLGRSFFYYYPEMEENVGRENLITVGKMIFSMLHSISITYVEKEACTGHLVFISREQARINIPLNNLGKDHRLTRKLLSLSSEQNSLLCDHDGPYGLGTPQGGCEPIFTASFSSHGNWEIHREGKSLACVQSGNVCFHRSFIASSVYRKTSLLFEQVFGDKNVHRIVSIINRVITREKGTILVFHRNAVAEAERLKNRGCLTQVRIDRENMALLDDMITIDGALLFDLDCTCHAIGMILDGKVRDGSQGDRNRGARYNSACTYVDSTEGQAIAVVISEDGAIDFFPALDTTTG